MKGVPRGKCLINLTGQVFGRLTVLHEAPKRGHVRYWNCQCLCGAQKEVSQSSLIRKLSTSCGCRIVKHGQARSGAITRTWHIWDGIHSRCKYPKDTSYRYYGALGITVCERWGDFSNFFRDMGDPPSSRHTIERRDSKGHYEPDNCRWATRKEQGRNRSSNCLITFKDQTKTQVEWADATGLSTNMIHKRLVRGWSIKKTLTTPAKRPWAKPHAA